MGTYLRLFVRTRRGQGAVAVAAALIVSLLLRLTPLSDPWPDLPLFIAVAAVSLALAIDIARAAWQRNFGADILALMAMVTAAIIGEWIVAAVIAVMVTSGTALEAAASQRASQVLRALAQRSPRTAHRRNDDSTVTDITADMVQVGDALVLLPHEIAPVDGTVTEGVGSMDEAFLTGEPYQVPKTIGSPVMSGAINGTEPLVIIATAEAGDSRYAQIAAVLATAESQRPPIRRLADRLGIAYTLIALALAFIGWWVGGDVERFLAVLVIATPCPLLIGVPVAVIGAISRAAAVGIIVKDPSMLERITATRTMIFDKTGTLTYGRPRLTRVHRAEHVDPDRVLSWMASLEDYSRHPLASAISDAAQSVPRVSVSEVEERPGQGLTGLIDGHRVTVTGRAAVLKAHPGWVDLLPEDTTGLECILLIDGEYAATMHFEDEPREGAAEFIRHLSPRHQVDSTIIISGDRASAVADLSQRLGIGRFHASVSPEDKLELVRAETERAPTAFLGDGINDAPAMTAATIGIAFGRDNQITAEAADAVILDSSFDRLDELLHIGARMRRIALQTAIGGMALSGIGMILAIFGLLPPLAGAIAQEVIDVLAILNATRVALTRRTMADYRQGITPAPSWAAAGDR